MSKLPKKMHSVYPMPVYEAHFADGTVLRMTVWHWYKCKQWDFERCRKLLTTSHSGSSKVGPWPTGQLLVDGYLEQDIPEKPWFRLQDPLFSGIPQAASDTKRVQYKKILLNVINYLDGKHNNAAVIEQARELLAA